MANEIRCNIRPRAGELSWIKLDCCGNEGEFLIGDSFGNDGVRVEGACDVCGAEDPMGRITDDKEFYFRVFDNRDAMVMVIDRNGNYSQHLSTDETEGDGDGSFGPYHWNDSEAWSKTTRKHAESMLRFTFTDLEL